MAPGGLHKADYLGPLICFLQESTVREGIRVERGGSSPSQAQVTWLPRAPALGAEGTLQVGFTFVHILMLTLPVSSAEEH